MWKIIFFFILCISSIIYFQVRSILIAEEQGFKQGYKEACIDFYKGKVKMELKEKEDGTKEWVWYEGK